MPNEDAFKKGQAPETKPRGKKDDNDDEEGEPEGNEPGGYNAQGNLIDVDDPDKKKILTIARRIKGRNKERQALQASDEKDREKLAEAFHEKKITKFVGGGFEINLRDLGEKVSVKATAGALEDE